MLYNKRPSFKRGKKVQEKKKLWTRISWHGSCTKKINIKTHDYLNNKNRQCQGYATRLSCTVISYGQKLFKLIVANI